MALNFGSQFFCYLYHVRDHSAFDETSPAVREVEELARTFPPAHVESRVCDLTALFFDPCFLAIPFPTWCKFFHSASNLFLEMVSMHFLYSSLEGIVLHSLADSLFQLKNCTWYSTLLVEALWSRFFSLQELMVRKHGQYESHFVPPHKRLTKISFSAHGLIAAIC